jgi:cold shock CspA family protein
MKESVLVRRSCLLIRKGNLPDQTEGARMRGSITRLSKKLGCGFILGEDGCEAYFDLSSLGGTDIRSLSIGKRVEYQEHFGNERLRAVNVKVMPNPSSQSARQA